MHTCKPSSFWFDSIFKRLPCPYPREMHAAAKRNRRKRASVNDLSSCHTPESQWPPAPVWWECDFQQRASLNNTVGIAKRWHIHYWEIFVLTPELGAVVVRLNPLWGLSPCNLEKADTRVLLSNCRLGAPEALLYPWCLHTIGDSMRHFRSWLLLYLWQVRLHQSCLGYLLPRCAQVVTSLAS